MEQMQVRRLPAPVGQVLRRDHQDGVDPLPGDAPLPEAQVRTGPGLPPAVQQVGRVQLCGRAAHPADACRRRVHAERAGPPGVGVLPQHDEQRAGRVRDAQVGPGRKLRHLHQPAGGERRRLRALVRGLGRREHQLRRDALPQDPAQHRDAAGRRGRPPVHRPVRPTAGVRFGGRLLQQHRPLPAG
uniref:(northern house mosquito) hypothetical protein n=1 Tax=Culex pipiens TaxID=7175 RepID=A0A8D8BIR7_CULPI